MWQDTSHPLSRRLRSAGVRIDSFDGPGTLGLLSHFHGDHRKGLSRKEGGYPLVVSPETARLAEKLLRLPRERLAVISPGGSLEFDAPFPLRVTALEANHCPGALMFLLEWDEGRVLYTGDFRFSDAMRPALAALPAVDLLIVDNTYDDPRYVFPPLEKAVEEVVALATRHAEQREVAIAIYSIGKTRILAALHERLGLPTYVGEPTAKAYAALGLDHLVTRDKEATPLRGYARGFFDRYFKMRREYRDGRAVAIIPTGWAVDVRRPEWNYHYVPYSEHCDWGERQEFVRLVRPVSSVDLLPPRPAASLEETPERAPW